MTSDREGQWPMRPISDIMRRQYWDIIDINEESQLLCVLLVLLVIIIDEDERKKCVYWQWLLILMANENY